MNDSQCVEFLRSVLPRLGMRWPGFRKVRRQVCKRVARRLRELGFEDVRQYWSYLNDHTDEWSQLDEFCRISISRFYRDRGVFDLLRDRVLPDVAARRRLLRGSCMNVWSAGCASGEEPYTIELVWQLAVAPQVPAVGLEVVATDADPQMLERARRAVYPTSSLKDLPATWRARAFEREGQQWRLRDAFRKCVEFRCQDLREQQPHGPFDVVFCRHFAFTYYEQHLQERMLEKLLDRLDEQGVLVTGKQETLPEAADAALVAIAPHSGVYRRRR